MHTCGGRKALITKGLRKTHVADWIMTEWLNSCFRGVKKPSPYACNRDKVPLRYLIHIVIDYVSDQLSEGVVYSRLQNQSAY